MDSWAAKPEVLARKSTSTRLEAADGSNMFQPKSDGLPLIAMASDLLAKVLKYCGMVVWHQHDTAARQWTIGSA